MCGDTLDACVRPGRETRGYEGLLQPKGILTPSWFSMVFLDPSFRLCGLLLVRNSIVACVLTTIIAAMRVRLLKLSQLKIGMDAMS